MDRQTEARGETICSFQGGGGGIITASNLHSYEMLTKMKTLHRITMYLINITI